MAYNRDNFLQLKNEYENKRKNAVADAEARKAELHLRFNEIKKIDEKLQMTGINILSEAMKGKAGLDERIDALKKENEQLLAQRAEILKKNDIPEDYSDVKYECKDCSDTGYIGIKMCHCFKNALIKKNFESAGLGAMLKDQSFETFDLSFYLDNKANYDTMKINLEKCKSYAEQFAKNRGNLLFVGATGLGKTHLSSSIAKSVIEQGFEVVYDTAQNILGDFEKEQFKYQNGLSEKYFECDLLIIDDLGTEMSTAFTVASIYNIINTRLNSGKSTIINTNLSHEELRKRYSDRITSRLLGCFEPLIFKGTDIRMKKLKR